MGRREIDLPGVKPYSKIFSAPPRQPGRAAISGSEGWSNHASGAKLLVMGGDRTKTGCINRENHNRLCAELQRR
jgi:hypothetical protein